jgi:hypothetical protein
MSVYSGTILLVKHGTYRFVLSTYWYELCTYNRSRFQMVILDLLSFLSWWAGARRAASLSAFRDGIGRNFKNAPIANHRRHLILN